MQQKWFQVIQKATTMVKEVMTLYMPQKWFQVIQKGTTMVKEVMTLYMIRGQHLPVGKLLTYM